MAKMPEEDKREFSRVPFRIRTTVRTPDRTIWSSSTLDVSLGGLRIETTEQAPPEGTKCEIEIVLAESPEPAIIEARGEVIRSAPGTLAVRVDEIDIDSYEHLKQLVLQNAEDPEQAERQFFAHWGIRKPNSSDRE